MKVSELIRPRQRQHQPGEWPHTTDILREAGLVDVQWFTADMAERGTAVHLACQHLDEGRLDEATLADNVRLRLAAYRKFLREVNPRIVAIEQRVQHEALRYCGTLDRIVEIGGYGGVLDLKGPAKAAWQGVQCEAYRRCVDWTPKRWTLHLADDGYTLVEHKDRADWGAFCAALSIYQWKERNGCLTLS